MVGSGLPVLPVSDGAFAMCLLLEGRLTNVAPSSPAPAPAASLSRLQRKVPHVLSLTDFMGWRYGYVAKTYVVLLCLFNMSIGEPTGGGGHVFARVYACA
jgi:hypothetical protein